MLKRSLSLLALMLVMIPMAAFAGTVSTRVMTTGGSITVAPGGLTYTSANGTVSKYYTTAITVTANPATGYAVTSVKVNGVDKGALSSIDVPLSSSTQTVSFSFAAYKVNVTSSATTSDGTVSPYGTNSYYANKPVTYTFYPNTGKRVESITVTGAEATLDHVLPYAGVVKATFTPLANVTVVGSFVALSADAGANKTLVLNSGSAAATLAGSASDVAASYAWAQASGPAASIAGADTATPTVTFSAAGTYTFKLTATASGTTATDTTTVTVAATTQDAAQNQCESCHSSSNVGSGVYNDWNAGPHAGQAITVCSGCHVGADAGAHPGVAKACTSCHTTKPYDTYVAASVHNKCFDCHGHKVAGVVCANCHSGKDAEFVASPHWLSPTGRESDADFIAAGHGSVASCAAKCHFVQGATTSCSVCHSGALAAGGTISAKDIHEVNALANVDNTCYACHTGSKHGWSPRAFEKSTHFTGEHAIAYYQFDKIKCLNCHDPHSTEAQFVVMSTATQAKAGIGCQKCHRLGADYGIFAADGTLKVNADPVLAPHGSGAYEATATGTAATQYVTQGAICKDCHAHNNTINAGFAEGGHGKVSKDKMNAFNHYDWSKRTNNGTRQNGNCDRCHTAGGFIKFADQDAAVADRLKPTTNQAQNILVCVACHKALEGEGLENAPLRTDAIPAGNGQALSAGYFALFSSSASSITDGNTKIQVAFPGMKNSSICVPCHSGRSTDTVFIETIKKAVPAGNYSTINTGFYQHAANMGQTFIGKGGFDYTGKLATIGVSAHAAVQMTAADTQGPCVGCHHTTAGKTHSLEVDATSDVCVKCHGEAVDVAAAKAKFNAGVAVLNALAHQKLEPLMAPDYTRGGAVGPLETERAPLRVGRLYRTAETPEAIADAATKGYGAWYNWQVLAVYDAAAYAHNPAYARQLLNDTIDYLDNGVLDESAAATINSMVGQVIPGTDPAQTFTAQQVSDANAFRTGAGALGCVNCHDVAVNGGAAYVQDNNGVRAIMPEFNKRSHHIINAAGAAPTNAQCAVCHLEGKAVNGSIVVDTRYHMKDANIYLRDVDNASGKFVWNGADHTAMDNFCFACHDENGAADTATLQGLIAGATAKNPFADTLQNSYDQVARAGVVDVKTAFTTTNASHHAVSGQRYKYRFSTVANAAAWAARTNNPMPADSEIAEHHVGTESPNGGTIEAFGEETMTGDFTLGSATPGEGEATLFEAGKFVAAYTPLGASESVADNSTLHCGDCHTVGQWKNDNTAFNKEAIGAHGSNNEYMLRNNTGKDEIHNNLTYVCFNCHVGGFKEGTSHPTTAKEQILGYATAHSVSAFHIQCQADSADNVGATNRLNASWEPDKVAAYDFAPAPGATAALPGASTSTAWRGTAVSGSNKGSGNITGIACTNCHNSGLRKGFGGIHGGDNTYTDGLGRVQKTYRFMPGMGNYRYAPPGGWDGKDLSDSRFVTVGGNAAGIAGGKGMGGCYTNSYPNKGDENPGYSACSHHGTSTTGTGNGGYWGGTASVGNGSGTNGGDDTPGTMKPDRSGKLAPTSSLENPAWEPTIREATAGNALVTRPLKY